MKCWHALQTVAIRFIGRAAGPATKTPKSAIRLPIQTHGPIKAITRDPLSKKLLAGLSAYYQAAKVRRLASDLPAEAFNLRADKMNAVRAGMSRG